MDVQKGIEEARIKSLIGKWVRAVRERSLDRAMSCIASESAPLDPDPESLHEGGRLPRSRARRWFDSFAGAIEFEMHDVMIAASADVAVCSGRVRHSGTSVGGALSDSWKRVEVCCRKFRGRWMLTQELAAPAGISGDRAVPARVRDSSE